MTMLSNLCICILTFAFSTNSFAYRILGVFPHEGLSHYMMFEPLMLELAERGHEVVVISRFPPKKTVKNFSHVNVNVGNPFPLPNDKINFDDLPEVPTSLWSDVAMLYKFLEATEGILQTTNFQNFMKSSQKFDVVLAETFNSRLFYSLAYIMRAPLITLSSCILFPWPMYDIANPINPSYIPFVSLPYSDKMNFFDRLDNALKLLIYWFVFEGLYNGKAEELKEKYLGSDLPPLREISSNTSLVIANSYFALNFARPFLPAVVEVGGLAVKQSNPLPGDIEKFINESTHGVVYFCMGSLLRGETFPEEKRNAFMYAFSKIPQRVLWKWEGDSLPGKSDNIMISKWMPQRDILAHPNVKLFISHGGLLGTSEAVYEGVPILGIPIFGDQKTNVKTIEANGAGEYLDYNEISKEVVLEKIQRLLTDPKYKENAKQLSERYRDRPMSPLDTAVYWTEYVIRHKGAPHLKSAAVELTWYQYLLLDVIAFLLFVVITALVIIYYTLKFIIKFIISLICGKSSSSKSTKKQKKN